VSRGGGRFGFLLLASGTAAVPIFENLSNPEQIAVMKVDITSVQTLYSKAISIAQMFSEL
jgi:hypothetical protein